MARRSIVVPMCALLAPLAVVPRAAAEVKTWDGGAATFSWHDGANWDPDGVPGPLDDVTIDIPAAITVTYSTGSSIINSLTCAENLTLSGGTLTIAAASSISGTFTQSGSSTLDGAGNLTCTGTLNWVGGTMSGAGQTIIDVGAALNLTTNTSKTLSRALVNDGTATWTSTATSILNFLTGSLTNNGSFTANSDSFLSLTGFSGTNAITNNGTFTKLGTGTLQTSGSAMPFTNGVAGVVDIDAGTLHLIGTGGTNNNDFDVAVGATLSFSGDYSYAVGSTITVAGTVRYLGGTHVVNGPLICAGTMELNGGIVTFPVGQFQVSGSLLIILGTLVINDPVTLASFTGFGSATVTFNDVFNYTGAITINGSASFAAAQSFSSIALNGTLTGAGTVTVPGTLNWAGGTISGAGQTIIDPGATLSMTTGGTRILSRALVNNGTVSWATSAAFSSINLSSGSIVNNGAFNADAQGAGTTLTIACTGGTNSILNNGTLTKIGRGMLTVSGPAVGTFTNSVSGTIDVDAGTLRVALDGINNNDIDVASAGTLDLRANYTYAAGSTITAAGRVLYVSGTHTVSTPLVCTGTLEFAGGTVTFPPGQFQASGDLIVSGGTIVINDPVNVASLTGFGGASITFASALNYTGAITINGSASFAAAQSFSSIALNGTLTGAGTVTATGPLDWLGGTMSGAGQTIIDPAATLRMTTAGTRSLSRALVNNGTAIWPSPSAASLVFTNGTFINNGSFTPNSSSTLTLSGQGGVNAFTNNGTFTKQGSGLTQISGGPLPFTNTGDVSVLAGTFSTASSYTQTAGSTTLDGGGMTKTGAAVALQGGTLGGVGTLTGAVANTGGTVAPGTSPGTFTVSSTLSQNASSTLEIELGGTEPGEFDVLNVNGALTLSGTLSVIYVNGYVPACRPNFTIINAGSISETFSSVISTGGPPVSVTYNPTTVVIAPIDQVDPVISFCPGEEIIYLSDVCEGAVPDLTGLVVATDNCTPQGSLVVTQSPIAGTVVMVTTDVTITVTDAHGNADTCVSTPLLFRPFDGPRGGSWFIPGNWPCGGVPTSRSLIYTLTEVLISGGSATASDVRIRAGAGPGQIGELSIGNGSLTASVVYIESGAILSLNDPDALLTVDDLIMEPGAVLQWNAGTIVIDGGTWTNPEPLMIGCANEACTLSLRNGAVVEASGDVNLCADGRVTGDGTLEGAVTSCGTVDPGVTVGPMTISGDYEQSGCDGGDGSDSGILAITLRENAGDVEFDSLAVSGVAALGGLLNVAVSGAEPEIAGPLPIFNAASFRSGRAAFDVALLPALSHPAAIALDYNVGAGEVQLDPAELFSDLNVAAANGLEIPENPVDIVVDDLDGDLDIDMAIGLPGNPGGIRTIRNNGRGSFPVPNQTTDLGGNDASACTGGDFDGDGDVDLALSNTGDDSVSIFMNDGDGNFTETAVIPVGDNPGDIETGFFNGDTDVDLIIANTDSDDVSILHGAAGMTFAAGPTIALGAPGDAPIRIAPATIDDADANRQDFVVLSNGPSAGGGAIGIYVNNGAGSFTLDRFQAIAPGAIALAAADLDDDGFDEIVTASASPLDPPDQVSVLVNRSGMPGGALLPPVHLTLVDSPRSLVAIDLDGDESGDRELAVLGAPGSGTPTVHVLRNDSDLVGGLAAGMGTIGLTALDQVSVGAGATALVAADLDGVDGPDLITINATGGGSGPAPELSIALNATIQTPHCPADCAGRGDGFINVTDLLALLAQWSGDGSCDLNGTDVVDVTDLLALLAAWGTC